MIWPAHVYSGDKKTALDADLVPVLPDFIADIGHRKDDHTMELTCSGFTLGLMHNICLS